MVSIRLAEIEKYAEKNGIPIMEKEGIEFLVEYIKTNNLESILEIGSAIGYSAIKMALVNEKIIVKTIERDKDRYDRAIKNIASLNLNNQISIENVDAFDFNTNDKYDLIFIDAAKSQSIKFFEKFKNNLKPNGIIITDNINFHGLTIETDIKSKNLRSLVRKINNFIEYLKDNKEFDTKFVNVGDGIAISRKN